MKILQKDILLFPVGPWYATEHWTPPDMKAVEFEVFGVKTRVTRLGSDEGPAEIRSAEDPSKLSSVLPKPEIWFEVRIGVHQCHYLFGSHRLCMAS